MCEWTCLSWGEPLTLGMVLVTAYLAYDPRKFGSLAKQEFFVTRRAYLVPTSFKIERMPMGWSPHQVDQRMWKLTFTIEDAVGNPARLTKIEAGYRNFRVPTKKRDPDNSIASWDWNTPGTRAYQSSGRARLIRCRPGSASLARAGQHSRRMLPLRREELAHKCASVRRVLALQTPSLDLGFAARSK